MYGIYGDPAGNRLQYEQGGVRIDSFREPHLKYLIERLVGRKARNNGVATHLLWKLRTCGSFRYDLASLWVPHGFWCRSLGEGRHAVYLLDGTGSLLLDRLNRLPSQREGILRTQEIRAQRRRLRELGLYQDVKPVAVPAIAGASARLKRHFRNTAISCADAAVVIAKAARLTRQDVHERILEGLRASNVATLRLPGGFVFRVDLRTEGRPRLLDIGVEVELRTTNDNGHGAYRRLRSALKKQFDCERRARKEAADMRRDIRKLRQTWTVLAA